MNITARAITIGRFPLLIALVCIAMSKQTADGARLSGNRCTIIDPAGRVRPIDDQGGLGTGCPDGQSCCPTTKTCVKAKSKRSCAEFAAVCPPASCGRNFDFKYAECSSELSRYIRNPVGVICMSSADMDCITNGRATLVACTDTTSARVFVQTQTLAGSRTRTAISQGPKHPREYPGKLTVMQYTSCLHAAEGTTFLLKLVAQIGFGKVLLKSLPAGSKMATILSSAPLLPKTVAEVKTYLLAKGYMFPVNQEVGQALEDHFLIALRDEWKEYCKCVHLEYRDDKEGCTSSSFGSVSYDGYMVYECDALGSSQCGAADRQNAADMWCTTKGYYKGASGYDVKYINVPYSIVPSTGKFCDQETACTHKAFGYINCV